MYQNVGFNLVRNGEVVKSINCKVEWSENSDSENIRFWDPSNGYGNSNPESAQNGWEYIGGEQNDFIALVEAVKSWSDWAEFISWDDGGLDEFYFSPSGKVNSDGVEILERISDLSNVCYYAVYQNGYAIFGVGKTDEEAIKDARQWMGNEELNIVSKSQAVVGDMVLIKISKPLYDEVKRRGGDVAFEECEDGICRLESEVI